MNIKKIEWALGNNRCVSEDEELHITIYKLLALEGLAEDPSCDPVERYASPSFLDIFEVRKYWNVSVPTTKTVLSSTKDRYPQQALISV